MSLIAFVTRFLEQVLLSAVSPLGWLEQGRVTPYYAVFPGSWVGSLSSAQWHNTLWDMDLSRILY